MQPIYSNNCIQTDLTDNALLVYQNFDHYNLKNSNKNKSDELIYQLRLPFSEFVPDNNDPIVQIISEEENRINQEFLDNLLEECQTICISAGINIGNIYSISINEKLCRVWGRCVPIGNRLSFLIELNKDLLKESVPITAIKSVILHELCHTVPDGHGHKKGWKDAAEKLKPFGFQMHRCSSPDELDVPEKSNEEYKYVFRCRGCGNLVKRFKASKFVRNYSHYRCALCGGEFEQIT